MAAKRSIYILITVIAISLFVVPAFSQTTRFPNGVTNVSSGTLFGDIKIPVGNDYIQFFEDFTTFTSNPGFIFSGTNTTGAIGDGTLSNWVVTQTEGGSGNASETISQGTLAIVTDNADNDNDFIQLRGTLFQLVSGKKTWFDARIKMASECEQEDLFLGLQIVDTTPIDTEGIYFAKDDGSTSWSFNVKNGAGVAEATPTFTLEQGTDYRFSWYYDGVSSINYYVNGTRYGTAGVTYMPTEAVTVSFGAQNGVANSIQLNVDYIHAARER